MKTYLSNILPRLQQFSKSLDHKEILVEQPWVLVDDQLNKHQYIFQRNGSLIVSTNGDVEKGTWEYISSARALLIETGEEKVLLKHGFINEGILILKKDGYLQVPWMVVNERVVPDLDAEKYINNILSANNISTGIVSTWNVEMQDGREFEFRGEGSTYLLAGTSVSYSGAPVPDGRYEVKDSNRYISVVGGEVVRVYVKESFTSDRGKISIYRQYKREIQEGDPISINGVAANGRYQVSLGDRKFYIHVQSGILRKISAAVPEPQNLTLTIIISVILLVLFVASIFGTLGWL